MVECIIGIHDKNDSSRYTLVSFEFMDAPKLKFNIITKLEEEGYIKYDGISAYELLKDFNQSTINDICKAAIEEANTAENIDFEIVKHCIIVNEYETCQETGDDIIQATQEQIEANILADKTYKLIEARISEIKELIKSVDNESIKTELREVIIDLREDWRYLLNIPTEDKLIKSGHITCVNRMYDEYSDENYIENLKAGVYVLEVNKALHGTRETCKNLIIQREDNVLKVFKIVNKSVGTQKIELCWNFKLNVTFDPAAIVCQAEIIAEHARKVVAAQKAGLHALSVAIDIRKGLKQLDQKTWDNRADKCNQLYNDRKIELAKCLVVNC